MIKIINCLLLGIAIQSCSSINGPLDNEPENTLTGYYTYGHEVNTFQPCNDKDVFWLTGENETLELMNKSYYNSTSQPYEEVYIKVIGSFSEKGTSGFSSDYDGELQIKKLIHMQKKSSTDCTG